jgi:hypothetical protein
MDVINNTITCLLKLERDQDIAFGLAMLLRTYASQPAMVRQAANRLGVRADILASAIDLASSSKPGGCGGKCGSGSAGLSMAFAPGSCGGLGQLTIPTGPTPPVPGTCGAGQVDCGPNATGRYQRLYDQIQIVGAATVTYTFQLDRNGYFAGLELFARTGVGGWTTEDVIINNWQISTSAVPLYTIRPNGLVAPNLVEIPAQLFVNAGAGDTQSNTSTPYRSISEGNNWIPDGVFGQLLTQGSGFVKFDITNKNADTINIPIVNWARFEPQQ